MKLMVFKQTYSSEVWINPGHKPATQATRYRTVILLLGVAFLYLAASRLSAQTPETRLNELETRMTQLENRTLARGASTVALFACGSLCALWAQWTRRNAWLWFFLGFIFNVFALLAMLYKNANEKNTNDPQSLN